MENPASTTRMKKSVGDADGHLWTGAAPTPDAVTELV